ncbi:winged helix-turn-helix transcriptional regulator [Dongia sp.]|uniref:winged helix-turn-helix transcriptional regulator n=1 Tax=Dongia sp. TaxID=1977262 RepID=UPI0035AEC87B
MALIQRRSRAAAVPETCAVGECMALLGGAWTPNLVWHLSGGPRRFGELKRDMPPISPKMLSARLRDLAAKGVVARVERPTSPPSVDYELTALGRELVPAIEAIVAVGRKLKTQQGKTGKVAE